MVCETQPDRTVDRICALHGLLAARLCASTQVRPVHHIPHAELNSGGADKAYAPDKRTSQMGYAAREFAGTVSGFRPCRGQAVKSAHQHRLLPRSPSGRWESGAPVRAPAAVERTSFEWRTTGRPDGTISDSIAGRADCVTPACVATLAASALRSAEPMIAFCPRLSSGVGQWVNWVTIRF